MYNQGIQEQSSMEKGKSPEIPLIAEKLLVMDKCEMQFVLQMSYCQSVHNTMYDSMLSSAYWSQCIKI